LNQSLVVTQAVGGALTLSGGITNATSSALTVTFNNDGSITNSSASIDNGLAGGTVALIENGPGTLTLAAANTYTGNTTVNGGALLVNGSIAASGRVIVNGSSSVLGGSGTNSANTIITNSGSLTPRAGGGSAATLTFDGDLTLTNALANFTVSTSGTTGNDKVIYGNAGSGTLTLSSSDTINITNSGGLDIASDYVLFANNSGGTVSMATTPTLKTNGVVVTPGPGKFVITNFPASSSVVLHYLPASSAPTVNSASASPASLGHYQTTTVTVNVTPASGKSITNLSVTVDGLVGAGDPVKLTGPGGNGSGNWTGTFTAAGSLTAGTYVISGLVQQNDGSTAGWSVNVTVINYSDVWSGGGGNNKWSTGGNWSVSFAPGTGDSVTMAGTTQTTNNLDSSLSVASLTFDGTAGSFDITNAASTLTLAGGVTNISGNTQTLDVPVALSGSQTINAASGNVTINGAVSGSGAGLTVLGSGTTITMAGNNSYMGGTTVSAGSTLVVSGNNTAATGATAVSGTLQLQNSNAVAGSAVTLNNGSIMNLLADANTTFTNAGTALPAGAGNIYNITVNSLNSPAGNGHTLALTGLSGSTAPNTSPIYVNVSSTSGDTLAFNNGLALTGTGSGAWAADEIVFAPNGANVILNGLSQSGLNGGILLNSSSTETLTINGNVSWSGGRTLFAEVLNGTLILNDSATGAQSGANWGFQGILYSGTLCLNSANAIISTSSSAHPSLVIYGGTLDNSSSGDVTLSAGPTVGINADFTFAGTHSLNLGTGVALMNSSHTLTVNSNTLTFGGSVGDNGSGYSLSLSGAGTLSLTGSNTYTGGTYVNAGTLALSSALTGTTATGNLTVNDGGTLQVSAAGSSQLTPSTLTLGSGAGAVNAFATVASTAVAPVHATNLVLNGVSTISIKSGTLQKGQTYPLIAYDNPESGGGSVVLGSLPPLVQGYLTDSGSTISVTITNIASEIWSGAANGTWDSVSLDWKTNGVSGTYIDGAPAVFNDTASGTTSITNIPTVVSPFSLTVSNNSKAYSFAGGTIGGSGALTKDGSSTLTLLNTNTYTGGTTVSAGSLQLGDGSINNGVVAGSITDNANLVIANPLAQTFANNVSGSGNLTKTANGTLTVSGANTYGGTTTVKQGTLSFSAANNLSTNTVVLGDMTVGADAALQLTAALNVSNSVTVASGAGARTVNTVGGSTFSGALTLNNNVTVIETGSGDSHLSGSFTGSGNVTVSNTTANIAWLDGSGANWTGAFIMQAGTVRPGTAGNQFNTNTVLSISSSNSTFLNVGGITADLHFAGVNDIPGATGGGFGGGSSAHNVVFGGSGNYTYSGGFNSALWGFYFDLAGSGKQTLTGTNVYSGSTTINRGTLALSGGGVISNTPNFAIGSGATFDVSGLSSTFGLNSGQTLRNTSVNGSGNIVGNVNLSNGSLLLNYTNGTPALSVTSGSLNFNANPVTVTVAGSVLPGGSYKLIAKGAGGSVAGTLPGSFTVNGTGAPTGATLQINSGELYLVVPSSVATLTNSFSGNTLTFGWPAGQGWTLESQTNNLSTGLTTNGWGAVSGGIDGSNSVTVDPTKPTVFFRLAK
jgi:autotransporter-associated beta strand protein